MSLYNIKDKRVKVTKRGKNNFINIKGLAASPTSQYSCHFFLSCDKKDFFLRKRETEKSFLSHFLSSLFHSFIHSTI